MTYMIMAERGRFQSDMPGPTSPPCAWWTWRFRVLVTYLGRRDTWLSLGLTQLFGLGHLALAVEAWSWLRSSEASEFFMCLG